MNVLSSYWKEFSLCSIFVLLHAAAFWMWYRVMPVMVEGDFGQYRIFILPVLLLLVAAALFSLVTLLVKHKTLLAGAIIIAALVPYAFNLPSSTIAWGALVLTVLFVWLAASTIQKEAARSLQYRISRFLRQGLGFYFTAAALVLSLFYLNRIDDQKVFSLLFPRPLFDFVLQSFSGTIREATGLPQVRPEQTVNEILTELIRGQLQSQGISFEKISKPELSRMLAAQRAEFAKTYHISIGGGEKIGAVFANAVTAKVKEVVGAYNRYLPLGAAIVFFFMLKTISVIPYFLAILLAVLLMKLLVLVKVVKKEKEQIEVERLVL